MAIRVIAAVSERNRRFLSVLKDGFTKAGVTFDGQVLEAGVLAERRANRDFDAVLDYWRLPPTSVDPREKFHTQGSLNESGYSNSAVDAWLDTAQRTMDPKQRVEIFRKFGATIARDQPVTILLQPRNALLLHKRFRDAEPGWAGAVPARWWVPPAERRFVFGSGR